MYPLKHFFVVLRPAFITLISLSLFFNRVAVIWNFSMGPHFIKLFQRVLEFSQRQKSRGREALRSAWDLGSVLFDGTYYPLQLLGWGSLLKAFFSISLPCSLSSLALQNCAFPMSFLGAIPSFLTQLS